MKYLIIFMLMINVSFAAHFNTSSDVPTPQLKQELSKFYEEKIKDKNIYSLTIEGHTDIRGSNAYNQKLSEDRAVAALVELIRLGLDTKSIPTKVLGMGETQPISNNNDENRRIVLRITSSMGSSITVIQDVEVQKIKEVIVERVFIKEVVKEKTIVKSPKKNRVSLLLGGGPQNGFDSNKTSNSITIRNKTGVIGGVQYQRLLNDKISIGAQVQTNESALLSIGLDF